MQCAAIKQTATKFSPPPAKLVKRMARGVGLAAEPAVGEMLTLWPLDALMEDRLCFETGWTRTRQRSFGRRLRSHHLTVDRRNQSQGNSCRSLVHANSVPIALAEVLMKLTESCVIEQHIDRILKGVEPTKLELGTPDAAALIVRIVRGWANDMAVAPKEGQDADVVLPFDLENAYGRAFRSGCVEAARSACPQLAAICASQWEPCDTRFWRRCDDGWTVDSTTRGGWQGSRVMQVMFVLGSEFALSKSDELAPHGITRIGFRDDMTFTGLAAALNRSWNVIEGTLADAGHRLRGYKCRVWAPGFEQFEDMELPTEVRNLSMKVPRKRHGVSLLGSAANTQHCMHVGLGQPVVAPTQTIERVKKALATLQSVERFACYQHDHVSFAKAWM